MATAGAPLTPALRLAIARFLGRPVVEPDDAVVRPVPGGHIHASFVVASRGTTLFLQRLNEQVFPDLAAVEHNLARITPVLRLAAERDPVRERRRRVLTPAPSDQGRLVERDADGGAWRAFQFIPDAHSVTVAERPSQAAEAARAFGTFFRDLAAFDSRELRETIPHFHDTPRRLAALDHATRADVAHRAHTAAPELAFAAERHPLGARLIGALQAGRLPLRVTHNDAKIANVLFDNATGEALCVVDLDTVMPGLAAWDVGDLVRSMASLNAEDDPRPVTLRWEVLTPLLHGWIEAAGPALTPGERASLVDGALVIAFEQGVRFLVDYLEADRYYMADRPGQNLDRARAQFALLRALEAADDRLRRLVESV